MVRAGGRSHRVLGPHESQSPTRGLSAARLACVTGHIETFVPSFQAGTGALTVWHQNRRCPDRPPLPTADFLGLCVRGVAGFPHPQHRSSCAFVPTGRESHAGFGRRAALLQTSADVFNHNLLVPAAFAHQHLLPGGRPRLRTALTLVGDDEEENYATLCWVPPSISKCCEGRFRITVGWQDFWRKYNCRVLDWVTVTVQSHNRLKVTVERGTGEAVACATPSSGVEVTRERNARTEQKSHAPCTGSSEV